MSGRGQTATSVAEVLELQGDAEVLAFQHRDDLLQSVAFLAAYSNGLTLGLAGDALRALLFDRPVDLLALRLILRLRSVRSPGS